MKKEKYTANRERVIRQQEGERKISEVKVQKMSWNKFKKL